MHVVPAREGESWESSNPTFRVLLFDTARGAVESYDILRADMLEAEQWAREKAGRDRLYAIAVVHDLHDPEGDSRGLIWLLGEDVVWTVPAERTDDERRTLERMESRRMQANKE